MFHDIHENRLYTETAMANGKMAFEKSKHLLRYYGWDIIRYLYVMYYDDIPPFKTHIIANMQRHRHRIVLPVHPDRILLLLLLMKIADLTQILFLSRIKYTSIWFIHGKQQIFIDSWNMSHI